MQDTDYGLDDFDQPKVFNELETIVNAILVLLFMKPGNYPSMPSLGINIGQYLYRFTDEINTEKIKSKLNSQCGYLSPYIQDGSLGVSKAKYKGRTLILVTVPTIIKEVKSTISIAITTNTVDRIIYNYSIDNNINL